MLDTTTAEAIKKNIIALLTGSSDKINQKSGELIPNNKTTDPFKINPTDNSPTYNDTFSIAKHITSKQKTIEFETKGNKQTISLNVDEVTQLPKYNIKNENQDDRDLQEASEDGAIENQDRDVQQAKVPMPTDFSNDIYLSSIVNSIAVSVANSVAESIVKVLMAKLEENQTEIEIEWDPSKQHQISIANLNGAVIPGGMGAVASTNGVISFKGGMKYKHKCKIKISNL